MIVVYETSSYACMCETRVGSACQFHPWAAQPGVVGGQCPPTFGTSVVQGGTGAVQ